jgi:hypothetical protein
MGRVIVVGATGLGGTGTGRGFVCPKDNACAVVVEGIALLGNGGDILNALVVVEGGDFTPKLESNPPKADVKSPNALPPPLPFKPPPAAPLPVTTGAAAGAAVCVCTFGAYNFKILFFKSFLDTAAGALPIGNTCGALCVRTGESNSNPIKL